MKEIVQARQVAGESKRRWFSSRDFDLIVWLAEDRGPRGFELCYDKQQDEHSITWTASGGFRHMAVDNGEQRPGKYKGSPLLVADGFFDASRIHSAFIEASRSLPPEIAAFVLRTLERHPRFPDPA